MSYSLEIVPSALDSLAQLDVGLQEETLDEIERLTREPHLLVRRGLRPGLVHDFTRHRAGVVDYVFIVVEVDDMKRILSVRRLGHVQKVLGDP